MPKTRWSPIALRLTVLLTSVAMVTGGPSVAVAGTSSIERIGGSDRYSTSAEVARKHFPTAKTAVLATGGNFPDALSAGPLAAAVDGPVLLTSSGASLPASVKTYISTQRAAGYLKKIYIIGSTKVVSPLVEASLRLTGLSVVRLAGADRYETSAEVADEVMLLNPPTDGTGGFRAVVMVDGLSWRDAAYAGPVAARLGSPLLLVRRDGKLGTGAYGVFAAKGSKMGATGTVGILCDYVGVVNGHALDSNVNAVTYTFSGKRYVGTVAHDMASGVYGNGLGEVRMEDGYATGGAFQSASTVVSGLGDPISKLPAPVSFALVTYDNWPDALPACPVISRKNGGVLFTYPKAASVHRQTAGALQVLDWKAEADLSAYAFGSTAAISAATLAAHETLYDRVRLVGEGH